MQYIDNDMDDLFKKAGEDYPLRTDGADWDVMEARLAAAPADVPVSTIRRVRWNRLWLLALIIVPVVFFLYQNDHRQLAASRASIQTDIQPVDKANSNSTVSSQKDLSTKSNASSNAPGREAPSSNNSSSAQSNPLQASPNGRSRNAAIDPPDELLSHPAGDKTAGRLITPRPNTARSKNTGNGHIPAKPGLLAANLRRGANADGSNVHADDADNVGSVHNNASAGRRPRHTPSALLHDDQKQRSAGAGNRNPVTVPDNRSRSGGQDVADTKQNASPLPPQPAPADASVESVLASGSEMVPVDSTTALRQPNGTDSVSVHTDSATIAPIVVKPPKAKVQTGLYYGLMVGPDVSTIKSQKVKNIGYSVGGVLGYRVDRHWAFEAGIFWDKKDYFSKGEYLDKTRTSIPANVYVRWVDGSCGMFEFPIAVRYDLNLRRGSFFGTVGLTTYVMKTEDYTYSADNMGTNYIGKRAYKNSGSNLFSNLQLSAGYNYRFSDRLSLRIEPYLKVPMKNIGIGSMPISSKGIYFGIMRSIR